MSSFRLKYALGNVGSEKSISTFFMPEPQPPEKVKERNEVLTVLSKRIIAFGAPEELG